MRILMFSGKGGVGKTSPAMIVARRALTVIYHFLGTEQNSSTNTKLFKRFFPVPAQDQIHFIATEAIFLLSKFIISWGTNEKV